MKQKQVNIIIKKQQITFTLLVTYRRYIFSFFNKNFLFLFSYKNCINAALEKIAIKIIFTI